MACGSESGLTDHILLSRVRPDSYDRCITGTGTGAAVLAMSIWLEIFRKGVSLSCSKFFVMERFGCVYVYYGCATFLYYFYCFLSFFHHFWLLWRHHDVTVTCRHGRHLVGVKCQLFWSFLTHCGATFSYFDCFFLKLFSTFLAFWRYFDVVMTSLWRVLTTDIWFVLIVNVQAMISDW